MKISRFILFTVMVLIARPVASQDATVRLGLLVNDTVANDDVARTVLDTFEAENPGIEVELISNNNRFVSAPETPDAVTGYLDFIRETVTSADVFMTNSNWLLPEATVGGYVLNLAPLVQGDPDYLPDRFIPQAWEAVQWDQGVWALPVTYDLVTLQYNPQTVEAAGLAPPDAAWTVDALRTTADALFTDEPVLYLNNTSGNGMMLASHFATAPLRDLTRFPATPAFDDPALTAFVGTLAEMQTAGQVVLPGTFRFSPAPPLSVTSATQTVFEPDQAEFVALQDAVGLQFDGFAVSRGTDHPEAAYTLAKFLTAHPEFILESALDAARTDITLPFDPDGFSTLRDTLLPLARPWRDFHYTAYLTGAIAQVNAGATPEQALQETQLAVETLLEDLSMGAEDLNLIVESPPERIVSSPDAVVLNFMVGSQISPAPTRSNWQRLADDFANSNPDVAEVNLSFRSPRQIPGQIDSIDCFYSPDYGVTPDAVINLRNLDPLLDSDPNFDRSDYLPGMFEQFTRDGQTWGLPLTMEPYMMWVNRVMFEEAGIPVPQGTWTVDEFLLAIDAFNATETWAGEEIIAAYDFDKTYLYLLMAAFGGAPYIPDGESWRIQTDDAGTVNAIRQVLDLALAGDLQYLRNMEAGSGITPIIITPLNNTNVRSGTLVLTASDFSGGVSPVDYEMIPFPTGDVTPVAFDVGGAFITAATQHPDLCYEFIQAAANDATLFSAVPVRFSTLDDPALAAARRESDLAFYRQMAEILTRPDALILPTRPGTVEFTLREQFDRVFDIYTAGGDDLEGRLMQAADNSNAYLTCLTESDPPAEGEPPLSATCREAINSAG